MLVLIAGLGFVFHKQDATAPFRFSASTVEALLTSIGHQTGDQYTAAKSLQSKIIFLNPISASVPETLTKLAGVLGAQWEKSGGVHRLVEAPSTRRSFERAQKARRLEKVKEWIRAEREELGKLADFSPNSARQTLQELIRTSPTNGAYSPEYLRASQHSPALTALREALVETEPQWLAEVPRDRRSWYSDQPTPTQSSLGRLGDRIKDRFARYQNIWHRTVSNLGPLNRNALVSSEDPRCYRSSCDPKDLRIVLRFEGSDASFRVMAWFVNAKGEILGRGSQELSIARPSIPSGPSEKELDQPLELGPEVLQYLRFFGSTGTQNASNGESTEGAAVAESPAGTQASFDRRVNNELLYPERHEPLAMFVSPLLASASRAIKRNMIGVLTDQSFEALRSFPLEPARQTVRSLTTLLAKARIGFQVDGDWLVLESPTYENEPRATLGRLARSLKADGVLTPSALFAYAGEAPDRVYTSQMFTRYANTALPGAQESMAVIDLPMVRFLGRLNTTERTSLLGGEVLSLASISRPAIDSLWRTLYLEGGFLTLKSGNSDIDLGFEVTEALPNGIPGGQVRFITPPVPELVLWSGSKERPYPQKCHYAMAAALISNSIRGGGDSRYVGFSYDNMTSGKLMFQFSPSVSFEREVNLPSGKARKILPMSALPDEIKKMIDEMPPRAG